jgi:hypothetical protein
MLFRLMLPALFLFTSLLPAAAAAELEGVTLPDTRIADGTTLHLNGIGIRTYSILRIHIYVAGLYLERPSKDADAIMRSPELKMLDLKFLRDVDAERARHSWREGLEAACQPPCVLKPADLERFLAQVPALNKGDETQLLFTPEGVQVTANGKKFGEIHDPHFAAIMLASFLGADPPTPQLKQELLGLRD